MKIIIHQEAKRDNNYFGVVVGPSNLTVPYIYDPNDVKKTVNWGVSILKLPFREQDLLCRLIRATYDPIYASTPPVVLRG